MERSGHLMWLRDRPATPQGALTADERAAVGRLIARVRSEVPADLVQASLFGSKARGDDRPDSDLDVLLVFRVLPPDREPQASRAEEIADQTAAETGVPVTVWSVSLQDLEPGARTPMLVDALEDSIELWCSCRPLSPVPFTPADAVRCAGALLDRVAEGEMELDEHFDAGAHSAAAQRVRDDLVRMCTAIELLRGRTRLRRADVVRSVLRSENGTLPMFVRLALGWAAASFGPDGRDGESLVPPPPDPDAALLAVGHLRRLVRARRDRLVAGHPNCTPAPAGPDAVLHAIGAR
jgi:hypothetical protein